MTWAVRLAEAGDYQAVRDLAQMNHAESCPQRDWSEGRMHGTFFDAYLRDTAALIFVATWRGEIVGFMLCGVYQYRAFDGLFSVQEVLFVRPDKRGTRAAAILMRKLIDFSISAGASEIIGGNDNDIHSEQTARFLARFGFRSHGYAMRLDLHGR